MLVGWCGLASSGFSMVSWLWSLIWTKWNPSLATYSVSISPEFASTTVHGCDCRIHTRQDQPKAWIWTFKANTKLFRPEAAEETQRLCSDIWVWLRAMLPYQFPQIGFRPIIPSPSFPHRPVGPDLVKRSYFGSALQKVAPNLGGMVFWDKFKSTWPFHWQDLAWKASGRTLSMERRRGSQQSSLLYIGLEEVLSQKAPCLHRNYSCSTSHFVLNQKNYLSLHPDGSRINWWKSWLMSQWILDLIWGVMWCLEEFVSSRLGLECTVLPRNSITT